MQIIILCKTMMNMVSLTTNNRKRKTPETPHDSSSTSTFPLDALNQDLLEKVLSWLPPSTFFRFRSVCRKWNSIAPSPTFRLACSEIRARQPWFLMVGEELDQSVIFDTSDNNWRNLHHPNFLQQTHLSKSIPVASSGSLVCFKTTLGDEFVVCNLVTGACRELPLLKQAIEGQTLHAIGMNSSAKNPSLYRIVLVYGDFPNLSVRIFDSEKTQLKDEFLLKKNSDIGGGNDEPETMYFLSKAGDVVATNMQRSPSKQYSSVLTVDENGEETVHFLSHSGTVVSCNLTRKTFSGYPRLLPIFFEYSIDLVECNGEVLVVVLSDFLESSSLRVWRFSNEKQWQQVAAMPSWMSHEFFGKKADINCVGFGDSILICLNSSDLSGYVMCDLKKDEWDELPKCFVNGRAKDFMSAFSFEPRLEVSV